MQYANWLRSIAAIGLLLFGAAFVAVISRPDVVERAVTGFIEREAADEVRSRIERLELSAGRSSIETLAKSLRANNIAEQRRLRKALAERVDQQWARAIAEVRDLSCACRERIAELLRTGMVNQIQLLSWAESQLNDFIQGQYMRVRTDLMRDLAIFTASNATVFLVLLMASFLKPRAVLQLFVPGVLLALSSLVCTGLYVFEQNWLLTVIYGDYLGGSYLAYLSGVFALLCDVMMNRARVTTEVFNGIAGILGSALSTAPC